MIGMNSILIVENVQEQRQFLMECASGFNSDIKIYSTDKKSEALRIINNNDIAAFFLDIRLADGSGIELAREIRKNKKYQFTPIIFITGVYTKEMEAYRDIHCYEYIIKPYSRKSISDIMQKIMVDYFEQTEIKYLNLEFKGLKQRVNIKDIIYVECVRRRIFIRTQYENIPYRFMNIGQFCKELPDYFSQIHQSIIVNRNYVEKIDTTNNMIKLKGVSESVPIGVSYRKKVGELIHGDF